MYISPKYDVVLDLPCSWASSSRVCRSLDLIVSAQPALRMSKGRVLTESKGRHYLRRTMSLESGDTGRVSSAMLQVPQLSEVGMSNRMAKA